MSVLSFEGNHWGGEERGGEERGGGGGEMGLFSRVPFEGGLRLVDFLVIFLFIRGLYLDGLKKIVKVPSGRSIGLMDG